MTIEHKFYEEPRKQPAVHFCQLLSVNVDNQKLSDADFRDFIRNSLPLVEYERIEGRSTR